jgi:hypothetical protein
MLKLMSGLLVSLAVARSLAVATTVAQEPAWNPALVLDEQKQTVGTFPLFVHDGTRRGAAPDAPPGMLQNLVTMETFSVRGGLIRHVEAAPFVTLPYGLGNGWTPGSGR